MKVPRFFEASPRVTGMAMLGCAWASTLVLAAPAASAQSVSDYRLPPGATPSAPPRVPGPVDPDAPAPRGRSTPPPVAQPSPTITLPPQRPAADVRPAPSPRPTARPAPAPGASPGLLPRRDAPPVGDERADGLAPAPTSRTAPATAASVPRPDQLAPPSSIPTAAPPSVAPAAGSDTPDTPWPWIALAALLALGAGVAAWALRRRSTGSPSAPAVIERPVPAAPAPPPPPPAAPAPAPASAGIELRLEAIRMVASFRFATLHYRLAIGNGGNADLADIAIGADIVAAHADLPVQQQMLDADTQLDQRHAIAGLAAGEETLLTGELRLPLEAIRPIRQGNAALFVPLVRITANAADLHPLARTFVVGVRPSPGSAGLQPFRIDQGPRSWQEVGQRPLAA